MAQRNGKELVESGAGWARLAWFLVPALGALLVLITTKSYLGIGTDGIVYLAAARHLSGGLGLTWIGGGGDVRPIVIFAPLFPSLLGAAEWLGIVSLDAARWMNALAFAGTIALMMAIVNRLTGRFGFALLAGLLTLFSRDAYILYMGVQSEPLFILLFLGSLFLLTFSDRQRDKWFLFAGVLMGLTYLARYAGGLLVLASAGAIALGGRGKVWERLKSGFLWLGIGVIPAFLWTLRNAFFVGSAASRSLQPQWPPRELFLQIIDTVTFWLLPDRVPLAARSVFLILLLVAGVVLWRRLFRSDPEAHGDASQYMPCLLLLTGALYSGGLLLIRQLLVPRIDVYNRTLIPLHLLILLLILLVSALWLKETGGIGWSVAVVNAGLLLFGLSYLARGTIALLELQVQDRGYLAPSWQESPLLNAMALLPEGVPIYTNEVEAVYLYLGRHPYRLPHGCVEEESLFVRSAREECRSQGYLNWVGDMREALQEQMAVIALFDTWHEQPYYQPLVPDLVRGLEVLTEQGDGFLYVEDRSQWPDSPHW